MTTENKSSSILILCQLFYPELVSTGQTLTELAEELVKLGTDVNVVCGPPTIVDRESKVPRHLVYKGIKIKRVLGTRFSKLNFIGKFLNQSTYAVSTWIHLIFDPSKSPMLVLTNPPFLGFICALLRKVKKRPYIFLVFDVYPDTAVKLGVLSEKGIMSRLWNRGNRFVLEQASKVIVIGRCMKDVILNKAMDIRSLPSKIQVIPIWSDDRIIRPVEKEQNPFVKKWALEGKFVISYSGNMGRFHDMETIMESAKLLNENDYIRFLFIGEGYKKKKMVEYAQRGKLDNCQFHTYVEREDLGLSLACADVGLVSLSPGQEGLSVPSKTFGIMASGVPVIGIMNRNSEIAMMVEETGCGFVVEPGDAEGLVDAIIRLSSNPDLCRNMGKNGYLAVKNKYNLKNAAREYFSVIQSVQQ